MNGILKLEFVSLLVGLILGITMAAIVASTLEMRTEDERLMAMFAGLALLLPATAMAHSAMKAIDEGVRWCMIVLASVSYSMGYAFGLALVG